MVITNTFKFQCKIFLAYSFLSWNEKFFIYFSLSDLAHEIEYVNILNFELFLI